MNKKGFTLVELLAVIAILAVLIVIAVPNVLKMFNESKEKLAIQNARTIIKQGKTYQISDFLTGGSKEVFNFETDDLNMSGSLPESGTLLVDKVTGNTSLMAIIDGKCVRKKFNEDTPIIVDDEKCEIDENEIKHLRAEIYKESILNGATPVITDKLIAVTIDDDGKVKKADIKSSWYDYENKKWANAIILKDESKEFEVNEVISEAEIESYFVWIPKYAYKQFAPDNYATVIEGEPSEKREKEIEIKFGTNNENGDFLTHPAFTNFNVNGLWVGKFEIGYDGASSTSDAEIIGEEKENENVIIKPNVYSWRKNTFINYFNLSYNYNRNLDSHMIKNTEWGAVAYLSHSKYGINKEININNNSSYKTGYGAERDTNQTSYPGDNGATSDITVAYNLSDGKKASTTGNITGIYDMSGGCSEFVAAFIDGKFDVSSAKTSDIEHYFDKYSLNNGKFNYENTKKGDAIGEMGPFYIFKDGDNAIRTHSWYNDVSNLIKESKPIMYRGGYTASGVLGGIFFFEYYTDIGIGSRSIGSRIVLAPK